MESLDPLGSETNSLFDDVNSPQRLHAGHPRDGLDRNGHIGPEPSLFVDDRSQGSSEGPTVIDRSREFSFQDSEDDVFEDAVPAPPEANGTLPLAPAPLEERKAVHDPNEVIIEDSELDDGESLFDESDDESSATATHEATPVNSTPPGGNANKSLGKFATDAELEALARTSLSVELPESSLLTPRSHYEPFEPGAPEAMERRAVPVLLEELEACSDSSDQDFQELHLNDFVIYNEVKAYGVEMRALTALETKSRGHGFVFDGILSAPGSSKSFFVRGVPIQALPIGNYSALDEHTVRDAIWILSPYNSRRDLYYKLCTPAKEYKRFYEPFIWVADLAKHFVDYLKNKWDEEYRVSVHDFRVNFKRWLLEVHGNAPAFQEWLSKLPRDDFRGAVIANLPFLHKEAVGVLSEKQAYVHTFWKETWSFTQYKPPAKQPLSDSIPPTIVTQYVKDCFQGLPFESLMKTVAMAPETRELRNQAIHRRSLEVPHAVDTGTANLSTTTALGIKNIRPGDTLSIARDENGHWERQEAKGFTDVDRWFVLVQNVHVDKKGERMFDVIWYYRPVDTLCGIMSYPWANELFLSNHCNCEERTKIEEKDVLGIHEVDFHGTGTSSKEVFCRQIYLSDERKWLTLEDKHLKCAHYRPDAEWGTPQYKPGETILAHLDKKTRISEPCEVVSSSSNAGHTFSYRLRRLLRRSVLDPSSAAAPNELVYTDDIVGVDESQIMDECHVRQFKSTEAIPTPYDRRGTGNFFYITHEQSVDGDSKTSIVPLKFFKNFKQGHNPSSKISKLRGMDLFCGGGNLGRGLEDGGGIEMKWANDYVDRAIHTYMANVDDPQTVHPFLGSIDIMQKLAILGKFSESVPRPGDVDFISGGSPCPGFSRLTNDKTTGLQRKNQSLVAAFASMIDLYRPKYGLLENVTGIVQKRSERDKDVLCQLICAVVGLGYQTCFYIKNANACGAPQKRARVFLVFAAPGCELPQTAKESHLPPPGTNSQSLGRLPNGMPMAKREVPEAAPFDCIAYATANADLPSIDDGKPDICVAFPDHRVTIGQTKKIRREVTYIPTQPYGMNFAKSWFGENHGRGMPGTGILTQSERDFFPPDKIPNANGKTPISRVARNSQAYGRAFPNKPIGTVTTRLSANDAKDGRCLHWFENRMTSLMEARRAQGFRDEDVLLGTTSDQYKIVGNSVAREVSVALGITFREAWVKTLEKRRKKRGNGLVSDEVKGLPTKNGHLEPIIIDSTDVSDADVQLLPRSSSSSSDVASKSQALQRTSSEGGLNANDKRRASATLEDNRTTKARRRSSTSLTLTQESSKSGNAETTRTTMTVTTVNEVEQPNGRQRLERDDGVIVIDDD